MYPKLALITGASSGLGEALATLLASKKIPLFLTGRDEKRLHLVAKRLKAEAMVLDLAKTRAPLLDWIRQNQPDLVINNAGFALYGPVLMQAIEKELAILEVNGSAAVEITIGAARALHVAKKKGIILNVSSAAGELPFPTLALYAAAKALITSFSKSFDAEMSPFGIRILAALPGQIATPFAARASGGLFEQRSFFAMSPETAAAQIWRQIEKQKGIATIGALTRIGLWLAHFFPRSLIARLLRKSISNRR